MSQRTIEKKPEPKYQLGDTVLLKLGIMGIVVSEPQRGRYGYWYWVLYTTPMSREIIKRDAWEFEIKEKKVD